MHDPQQVQESWSFIGQMANDFIRSLPPSVADAMTQAVNHHFGVINPVLIGALNEDAAKVPPKALDE